MRPLALTLVLALALPGCLHVEEETRTELGARLERFDRPQVLEGGVFAEAAAAWPTLELHFVGYDTCRTEDVERYAQDTLTERHAPGAGAVLSTGIAATLAGVVLLAASPAFSAEPDRQVIDGAGRFGPAPRQYATAWGVGLLVAGVPALATGLIGLVRSRDSVEHGTVEQVVGQREGACHPHPVDGPVELWGEGGAAGPSSVSEGGAVKVDASSLTRQVTRVTFHGREASLSPEARATLQAFAACARLEQGELGSLDAVRAARLLERADAIRACRGLRPGIGEEELPRLDEELGRRRALGEVGAARPGADAQTFEEAVAARAPTVRLAEGSKDLDALPSLEGRSALLEGVVEAAVAPNIGVVRAGAQRFFVVLPAQASWLGDYPAGTAVEAVVVVGPVQALGEFSAPVLRAIFVRARAR